MKKEKYEIGYKIFSEYKGELYSYLLNYALYYDWISIKQRDKLIKLNKIIKYRKNRWIEGKPWVALFSTLNDAINFSILSTVIIKKVKYIPCKEPKVFYTARRFVDNSFKKLSKNYMNLQPIPDNTIFASKIKIIKE